MIIEKVKYVLSYIKYEYQKTKQVKIYQLIKGYIKNHKKLVFNEKVIFILTTPNYGNLGDHAIAYAEIKLLQEEFPDHTICEIEDDEFNDCFLSIVRNIKKDDMVCLMGGGNFGVLYPEAEFIRRIVIRTFKNNKIVMFPQTIDFGNGKFAQSEFKRSVKIYSKNRHLVLMAREEKSYQLMKNAFSNNIVKFAPDIVMTLEPMVVRDFNTDKRSVLVCLRDDNERATSDEIYKNLMRILKKRNLTFQITDTETHKKISKIERERWITDKLKEFINADYVVTDRLHGMIFSLIVGTPCLVFDNKNKKISGVYSWIKDIKYILMSNSKTSLEVEIEQLLNTQRGSYNSRKIKKMFKEIIGA